MDAIEKYMEADEAVLFLRKKAKAYPERISEIMDDAYELDIQGAHKAAKILFRKAGILEVKLNNIHADIVEGDMEVEELREAALEQNSTELAEQIREYERGK